MKFYGRQSYYKKKVSCESDKNFEKLFKLNIHFIHQIFNTINISFLVLIFVLFFLSLESQRKWSNTYKILSRTKEINNNLIDYISQTEEFYISELESLSNYRKTKPKDLIYLDRFVEKKESYFRDNFKSLIKGFSDSKYQKGY